MVKVINNVIDRLVKDRNRKKTDKLISFCKDNFLKEANLSILDLGCGNGLFGKALQNLPQVSTVYGVDVVDYRKTDIDFKLYEEGSRTPFDDNTFDITFIIEVLHHSEDAIHLLREARRVTKGQIVIFEDIVTSTFRLKFMKMFDIIMNMRHGVNTPLYFKSEKEWLTIFSDLNLTCERVLDYSFYSIYTPQRCRIFFLRN